MPCLLPPWQNIPMLTRRSLVAILSLMLCLHAGSAMGKRKDTKAQKSKEVVAEKLTSAEIAHRKNQRFFFSIGEGFEGSASDWTEYIVWSVGVLGVFYYMSMPHMRRNPYVDDTDEDDEYGGEHEQDQQPLLPGDDELFGTSAGESESGTSSKKNK